MSIFEAIELIVPCRSCGRTIRCRVRRATLDDTSMSTPNLIIRCPEHGETRMKIKKVHDRGEEPWAYMNKHDVEMGRGRTPQQAVDFFHGTKAEPDQDVPNENTAESGEDDRKPILKEPQEREASLEREEILEGDRNDEFVQTMEHLPPWFRHHSRVREWLSWMLERGVDAEALFAHRYVVLMKRNATSPAAPVQFLGCDERSEVDRLIRARVGTGEEIVFIRDQKQDEFLEQEVTIDSIERIMRGSGFSDDEPHCGETEGRPPRVKDRTFAVHARVAIRLPDP